MSNNVNLRAFTKHPLIEFLFKHPFLDDIYVSKDGRVYDEKAKSFYKPAIWSSGYRYIGTKKVCDLVCETFVLIPDEIKHQKLIVNHKNGIKTDDDVNNLEWVTYSGNVLHAYKTNLRTDNIPVLLKDLRTSEIKEFYSYSECARFLKTSASRISWCLKEENYGTPQFNFYLLIRKGQNWPEGGAELIGLRKASDIKETVVFDIKEQLFIIFGTQTQAADHTKISIKRIRDNLKRLRERGVKYFTTTDYVFMTYIDFVNGEYCIPNSDPKRFKKVTYLNSKQKLKLPFRKPNKILVENLITKEVTTYDSSEIFARKLGVKKNTLQKYLYKNNGIWKKLFKITYIPN